MERAERVVLLCIGLLFEPLLIPVLWLMLALTAITAGQRFVKVWRQAQVAPVTAARIELRRSRRQSRRVARAASAAAPTCRGVAPDRWPTDRRASQPAPAPDRRRDRRRLPHRSARSPGRCPSFVAEGLAPPIAFGASFASAERRAMVERHLRRVNPSWRQLAASAKRCRTPSTPTRGTGSRACACRRCRRAPSPPASTSRASPTSRRRLEVGKGVILALPAPRRLGVGRALARRPGPSGDGRRRAPRAARAVRLVRPPAQRARDDGRAARLRRRAARCSGPSRDNEIVCLLCDRDIQGGGIEVEFFGERTTLPAGPATLGLRAGAPILPVGVLLHPPGQRPPRHRPPADPRRAQRQAARRRHAGHPVPRTRARVPHPPGSRAVAPVPAELAERPRLSAARPLTGRRRPARVAVDGSAQISIVPSMQVTVPPATHTASPSTATCTRPARPSAVP